MKVRFHHSQPVTGDIVTFHFSAQRQLRYTAGQFIELRFPEADLEEQHKKRWFTLSSSPTEELLSITTRIRANPSPFKRHLLSLKQGDSAEMSQPMGDFVLPRDPNKPLLFAIGGIGITPLRSMLTYLQATDESRHITLLYAVSDEDHIAFEQLVRSMTDCRIFSPATQHLTAGHILEAVKAQPGSIVYLSGPEPMIEQLVKELSPALPQNQLITDYFPGYPSL